MKTIKWFRLNINFMDLHLASVIRSIQFNGNNYKTYIFDTQKLCEMKCDTDETKNLPNVYERLRIRKKRSMCHLAVYSRSAVVWVETERVGLNALIGACDSSWQRDYNFCKQCARECTYNHIASTNFCKQNRKNAQHTRKKCIEYKFIFASTM